MKARTLKELFFYFCCDSHEGDSENTTGGIAEMNASGDQNPDAPTATAAAPPTSPRRKVSLLFPIVSD